MKSSAPPRSRWITLALCLAVAGCGSARTVAATGPASPAPVAPSLLAPEHTATFAHFAVATDHPQASQAGAEMLAAGGTAADAAAAAMLALGVASPASSGLGGGGFVLYYKASDHRVTFLDFRESSPAAMAATSLTPLVFGPPSNDGGTAPPARATGPSVGVPGEPRGIEEMVRRFGHLRLAQIVAPAARIADEGWVPSEHLAGLSQRFVSALRHDPLGQSWVPDGADGIRANVPLRNPALAQTLRSFGANGANIFYEGPLAEEIVRATARVGGALTADDLRRYRVTERAPLVGNRYGHRWVTAPPESAGGYTLLASLALLERWLPAGGARPAEADVLHAMAESWRGPFIDRARYFGDPDYLRVPVDALLEPARIAARAALFNPAHARPSRDYDLPLPDRAATEPANVPLGTGTSHICVVDAEGNIASVTTTINIPFGAGVSVAGFWLNDELDDFTLPPAANAPAAALPTSTLNQPAPNRRPVSTMVPTIVFEGDQPVLVIGGSGGTRIVTSVVQAAWRAIALNTPVGEAVVFPRIHQAAQPDMLSAEAGTAEAVLNELHARGHQTDPLRSGAIVQAIRITRGPDGVRLEAASDPRKGGRPAGR